MNNDLFKRDRNGSAHVYCVIWLYELGLSDGVLKGSRDKEIESLFGTDEDSYAYYNRGFNFGKFMSRKLNKLDEKGDCIPDEYKTLS